MSLQNLEVLLKCASSNVEKTDFRKVGERLQELRREIPAGDADLGPGLGDVLGTWIGVVITLIL